MSDQRIGERLKWLRHDRGWSLRQAQEATGVSRAMLSKIERDAAAPTAPLLGRIAEGFGVSISQLVGGPSRPIGGSPILTRAADHPVFRVPTTGFERRSLSPVTGSGVDLAVNYLPPGESSGPFPGHRPGVEEVLAVSAGRLLVFLDSDSYALSEGDSIFYRAHREHRFDNPSTTDAAVFYIVVNNAGALG